MRFADQIRIHAKTGDGGAESPATIQPDVDAGTPEIEVGDSSFCCIEQAATYVFSDKAHPAMSALGIVAHGSSVRIEGHQFDLPYSPTQEFLVAAAEFEARGGIITRDASLDEECR